MLQHTSWFWSRISSKITIWQHWSICHYLLPWLNLPWQKSALKGWSFCDATDIIKDAMEGLNRLSQNSFQECFQHLYSHGQKYMVTQGGQFLRKWLYHSVSLRNKVIPGTFWSYHKEELFAMATTRNLVCSQQIFSYINSVPTLTGRFI